MAKEIPSYLRLHHEDTPPIPPAPPAGDAVLRRFCDAFAEATGWKLEVQAHGESEVRCELLPTEGQTPLELFRTRRLAAALQEVLGELQRTRTELWRREADLAAGVPVVRRADEDSHLAARLNAVIQGGAQAIGGCAAALYLLDDATTELKLRACWGLPAQRLLDPPRPLRGAVADLEALVGHAVVLEDTKLLPHWRVPEDFPSAVCVPVSSPTEPLGTLWIFGDSVRDYTPEQTNLAEIIAGRVAAELQRQVLLQECTEAKLTERQLDRAAQWQVDHLPNVKPLLDDWQLAGRREPANLLGRGFYDWFIPPDGSLALALGESEGTVIEAALTSASLQAMLRAHAQQARDAAQSVLRVNESFWNASSGGQFASLGYVLLNPLTGEFQFASAGDLDVWLVGQSRCRRLPAPALPLGSDPELVVPSATDRMVPGEALLLLARGPRNHHVGEDVQPAFARSLREILSAKPSQLTAERLLATAAQHLDSPSQPYSALLLYRTL